MKNGGVRLIGLVLLGFLQLIGSLRKGSLVARTLVKQKSRLQVGNRNRNQYEKNELAKKLAEQLKMQLQKQKVKKNQVRLQKKNNSKNKQEGPQKLSETFRELAQDFNMVFKNNQMDQSNFEILMLQRDLNMIQLKYMFNVIDFDKDGVIEEIEWKSFYHIVLQQMNECDGDGDSRISVKGMMSCIMYTEAFKNIKELGEDIDTFCELLDLEQEGQMNIFEYMFMQRVNLAWGECAAGESLSQVQVPCAMRIVVPGILVDQQQSRMIIQSGDAFRKGKLDSGKATLELLTFLEIAHIFLYFYTFELPYNDSVLQKKDFIRAVEFQTIPTKLNRHYIDLMFQEKNEMGLQQFMLCMLIFKDYSRFAKNNISGGLTEEEFISVLKQKLFSKLIKKKIESIYIPTLEQYEEAMKTQKPGLYTEKELYMTFLETSSRTANLKTKQDEEVFDEEKQKYIYRQFEYKGQDRLDFIRFLRFYKASWYFLNSDQDQNGLITYSELRDSIRTYDPPITLSTSEKQDLHYIKDFISTATINQLDLKQFYAMFMYKDAFQYYKMPNFNSFINEANLQKALYMIGLKTPIQTLSNSQQGTDPATNMPLYNYWMAFQEVMKVDIILCKQNSYEELQKEVQEKVG